MDESESEQIKSHIRLAFGKRRMPENVLAMPIAGDELPEGHPGYGKGEPIDENYTDYIVRYIQGRDWRELDPTLLGLIIAYFSLEALAYYMPAMLIYNIDHDYELFAIDLYLTRSRFGDDSATRDSLYSILSPDERAAVAAYMESQPREFSTGDVLFWKTGTRKWRTDR